MGIRNALLHFSCIDGETGTSSPRPMSVSAANAGKENILKLHAAMLDQALVSRPKR